MLLWYFLFDPVVDQLMGFFGRVWAVKKIFELGYDSNKIFGTIYSRTPHFYELRQT
jgi:hypothetical protein